MGLLCSRKTLFPENRLWTIICWPILFTVHAPNPDGCGERWNLGWKLKSCKIEGNAYGSLFSASTRERLNFNLDDGRTLKLWKNFKDSDKVRIEI